MIKPEELKIGTKYNNEHETDLNVLKFIGDEFVIVDRIILDEKHEAWRLKNYFCEAYTEVKQKPKTKLVKVADYFAGESLCTKSEEFFIENNIKNNAAWEKVIGSERTIDCGNLDHGKHY